MEAVQRDLNDPRLVGTLPSVNRVKVAEDMATADVYLVLMGTPGKQSAALQAFKSAAGMLRGRLGKAMATRTVPLLRFHIDEQYRREVAVLELIQKASDEMVDPPAENVNDEPPAPEKPATDAAPEAGDA